MRVLYLCGSGNIGGGNRSFLALWRSLGKHGVEPYAVVPAPGRMREACQEQGTPCEVVPYQQPGWLDPVASARGFARWRRLLRDVAPTLIHTNTLFAARSIAWPARSIERICHLRFPERDTSVRWSLQRIPKPDLFLFNSDALQAEMSSSVRRFAPRARQQVVHNGVDLDTFSPGQPADKPRVGILANLDPVKGHTDFLEMAKILAAVHPDLEFWIIGEDVTGTGYGETLKSRAAELSIDDRVRFLGHRSDVPAVLRELQVLVCCSHVEPFGRCLIEGMATGLPVVATEVGGMVEVLEEGRTGFFVPPRDPETLASRVAQLLADASLRGRLGSAARLHVEEHFSSERHAEKIAAAYRSTISKAHGADR